MKSFTDAEWLTAIRDTLADLNETLPKAKSEELKNLLEPLSDDEEEPDVLASAIAQSLEIIQEFPEVHKDLKKRLIGMDRTGGDTVSDSNYEATPGKGDAIPPGDEGYFVCPTDPAHLRTRRRIKGQQCPQHQVELIPESNAVPPKK